MVVSNENTWYDPVPQYDNITHVHVFNVDITVGVSGCAFIFTDIHERIKSFSITITVVSSECPGKYYGDIFSLEMLL
jgi:hypothetical protein